MYFRILKKDLKRKKTMNIILLIFIILATTFIASGANNVVSVMTALDNYFEKAEVPDYYFGMSDDKGCEKIQQFANENQYQCKCFEHILVNPKDIKVNGKKFKYTNTTMISNLKNSTKLFDKNDIEIVKVHDGELYVTAELFYSDKYDLKQGDTIKITVGDKTKEFKLKGCTKDALYGSAMIGQTRILMSESDYQYFDKEKSNSWYEAYFYTDDLKFMDKFNEHDINVEMNSDRNMIKTMYIMDMITALILLIVSICLMIVSMVILRFTINFTMSEEFREIGVMKAIGITNGRIRMLYILKYFAIAVVGSLIGFGISFPFGSLMIQNLSRNIIVSNGGYFVLNILCAVLTAAVVVVFCYFCTRKIKKFSPIDAIRNGEEGERYKRKGIITLSKSRLSPVWFMSVNDIFSGIKRFVIMILIFAFGILLILVPINTINTLKSDNLISWFSMAKCDHVIAQELLFGASKDNEKMIDDKLKSIEKILSKNNISADVFQEIIFRMGISHDGKKMSSLAFQGKGKVTTDMYSYLEGTPPQNNNEVGISHVVADNIDAGIGDTVEIKYGNTTKKYIVTALYQTMNNMGEGIRFYQNESLDYKFAAGCFGIQIKYTEHPDNDELARRKAILKKNLSDAKVYSTGEYINEMIGDIAGQLEDVKMLSIIIVLCINILVTVLMVKSFITKEKGEIGMLKAIGFRDSSLVAWQTIRIGIVLVIAIVLGTLFSSPVSKFTSGQVFKIMGAQSIEFTIKPMEVYIIYPLLVFGVTAIAAMLTALQIRKISASETSNIE